MESVLGRPAPGWPVHRNLQRHDIGAVALLPGVELGKRHAVAARGAGGVHVGQPAGVVGRGGDQLEVAAHRFRRHVQHFSHFRHRKLPVGLGQGIVVLVGLGGKYLAGPRAGVGMDRGHQNECVRPQWPAS